MAVAFECVVHLCLRNDLLHHALICLQKRGRGQKDAHERGFEAAFAGGQSLPHAPITKQVVYEPPAVLGSVPESMYLHVAAPYTSALPGSKVKPGPGNLGAFAAAARAHVGTGPNTTSSTSQRKQHNTANKPHHASPPKSHSEGDHLLVSAWLHLLVLCM